MIKLKIRDSYYRDKKRVSQDHKNKGNYHNEIESCLEASTLYQPQIQVKRQHSTQTHSMTRIKGRQQKTFSI